MFGALKGPNFIKQTFHEFAAQSKNHCRWARAYYERMKARGKKHHHCIRALAYKWIRIIYACWQDRTIYDDSKYMESLRVRNPELYDLARNTVLPGAKKNA